MTRSRPFALALVALGAGVAVAALLGPLALGTLDYRTSAAVTNQVRGGDAVALLFVAPVSILAGLLAWRGHRGAAVLALGPSLFAAYIYPELIVGNEPVRYAGNVERFFPLLLGLFVLGAGIALVAWSRIDAARMPRVGSVAKRLIATAMFAVALVLVFGLHLPTLVDTWRAQPARSEYLEAPTAFWMVNWMDLGIVAPGALAAGVGLLLGRGWALKLAYAILGWFALLGSAVSAMGIVMLATDDPDASAGLTAGFVILAAAFIALAGYLYRPFFVGPPALAERSRPPDGRPA